MVNVSKLHKYQTFGLMKIMFLKKLGLRLTVRRKCQLLILSFSIFPNFKQLLSKFHFVTDFDVSYEVLHVTSIFELHILDNETIDLLNVFEIGREMHFFFLIILNKKNIRALLLMIHLKCAVACYCNRNPSPIIKPF